MEENTGKIIDTKTLQVTESNYKSVAMESKAFKISLERVINSGARVSAVVTDRSPTIRKIMAQEYQNTGHQFDIWHVCKSKSTSIFCLMQWFGVAKYISKIKNCIFVIMYMKGQKRLTYFGIQ